MHRLPAHPNLGRNLGDRHATRGHRQHRLIPLLGHTPNSRSTSPPLFAHQRAENGQDEVSTINRDGVNHQPNPNRQSSTENTQDLVDLTHQHPNLSLLIAGPIIRLTQRRAKVRRGGYRAR